MLLLSSCALQNDRTLPMPQNYQNHTDQYTQTTKNQKISKTGFKSTTFTANDNTQNRSVNLSGNGYIKGIIKDIRYSSMQKTWIYVIKATDLSNNKLKKAVVYGKKGLGHIGDLVYAIINNGTITSLYIYKSAQNYKLKKRKKIKIKKKKKIKQKRKILPKKSKTPKIKRREQIISAPTPEKIVF